MKSKLLAAVLLILVFCTSCSDLTVLRYENGVFVSRDAALKYIPADGFYEPTAVGDPYAYYKNGDLTLYAIGSHDPTLWLTESYAGGATTVFHSDSITLPTLAEFGAEKIIVCQSENVTIGVMEITDSALIAEAVRLFTEGESCEWPLIDSTLRYDLKFSSSAWPQIYMNLIYGEFPEGNFLYERTSKRCVRADDLFFSLFHPDEVTA